MTDLEELPQQICLQTFYPMYLFALGHWPLSFAILFSMALPWLKATRAYARGKSKVTRTRPIKLTSTALQPTPAMIQVDVKSEQAPNQLISLVRGRTEHVSKHSTIKQKVIIDFAGLIF
jgi:hypothetical protein